MIANTKENLNAPSAGDTTSRLFDNIHLKRSDKEKISQKALSVSRRLSSAKSHQCSSKRCESRSNGRSVEPKPNDLNKQYRKLLMIKQHIFNNDLNVLQLSQQQPQHYEAADLRLLEGGDHALSDFEPWLAHIAAFLSLKST